MIDAVSELCSHRTWPEHLSKEKQHILVMSNVILTEFNKLSVNTLNLSQYLLALTGIVMVGILTGENWIIK